MSFQILNGIMIPFLGTALGASCIFFFRETLSISAQRVFTGFASGVMVAASVWSLLIPALELSSDSGILSIVPAASGFLGGTLFLLLLDHIIPHIHLHASESEGPSCRFSRTTKMVFAVTLHNIPEGMAVGIVYAGLIAGAPGLTAGGALALSLGIAIQNFPEGAIISLPLYTEGKKKASAFLCGVLSGAVEPLGAALTIVATAWVLPAMPYLLSFAAGAMMYVVVEELIPEMSAGKHTNHGVLSFAAGFILMMVLDVALG